MKDPLNPELLAALCHDLRGPLGALGTWLHVLNSDRADEQSRSRALAAMAGDVRALGTLIEQLSSLGSTLSGADAVTFEPVDLVPFIQDLLTAIAKSGGGEASLRAPDSSLSVRVDPVRFREAVSLLVSSAQGAPKGAKEIRIEESGGMAEIAVVASASPRALGVALARALLESQGGELTEARIEGGIALLIRVPRST